jgi:hypothetical protein
MDRLLSLRDTWILVLVVTILGDGVLWFTTHDLRVVLLITGMNLLIGLLGAFLRLRRD